LIGEIMTTRTSFTSRGDEIAAWLTVPRTSGPHPVVVLVHGGGATHEMMLDQYEKWFSEAGLAVLAFDFRYLGESGGQPRQLISPRRYAQDIDAALAFARSRPELDPDRVALWGTSFGASHVVAAAGRHPELAAAVVQCPVLNGRAVATRSGLRHLLRFTLPITSDLLRAALGRPRRYVPLVGRPGELAFVNQPGALEGWASVCPADYRFDNRVAAAAGLEMLFYNASARASRVRCPLLVCQSDREDLVDPRIAIRVAAAAPRGVLKRYDADHFTVYHPPLVEKIVADQIEFLTTHLKAPAIAGSRAQPHGD
jgi:fermentation-respiration switch protein FrsA (DUF1100 family)